MSDGRGFWDASVAMTSAAQRFHHAAAITSPYEGNPLMLTLFVLCRNQQPIIESTLDTILEAMQIVGISYEIIIIDDHSRDRSVDVLRRFIDEHKDINIVLRINHASKGLEQNYVDAAFIGRGKYFRMLRGDNSEPMETMVDILKTVGEADIVVPYYITSLQESVGRQFIAESYRWLLNIVCGQRINDYSGSPVHLRFNVMRWQTGGGEGFEAHLLCRLLGLGFTCKQVPCRSLSRRDIGWKQLISLPHMVIEMLWRRLAGNA